MKYIVKLKIKEIHKQLVDEIRQDKRSYGYSHLSRTYRHRHIAYCLLRGRTMDQIEAKVHPGNERDEKLVEKYMAEYTAMFEEVA